MDNVSDFIGKKIKVDLDEQSQVDWDPDWSDDGENQLKSGSGYVELVYRPYNASPVSDADGDFDETDNWNVTIGLSFTVDENNCISSIEFTADVSCPGDSGLGDCDPDDIVNSGDYAVAVEFLASIAEAD